MFKNGTGIIYVNICKWLSDTQYNKQNVLLVLTGISYQYLTKCHPLAIFTGQSSASWTIQILRDEVEENNEKLRVTLRSPVNAILGQKEKATVQIVNMKNGECLLFVCM